MERDEVADKRKKIEAETDDVEGHAMRGRKIEAETDDVEGHAMRGRKIEVDADDDDDVAGHKMGRK